MRLMPFLLAAVGLGGGSSPAPGAGAPPDLDVRDAPDFTVDRDLGTSAHVVHERTGGAAWSSRGYIHRSQAKRRKWWRRSPALRAIQGGRKRR